MSDMNCLAQFESAIPVAALQCAFDELRFGSRVVMEGRVEVFGRLVFNVHFGVTMEQCGTETLSFYLECNPKQDAGSPMHPNTANWGKYDVAADISIFDSDGGPLSSGMKACYDVETNVNTLQGFTDLNTLMDPPSMYITKWHGGDDWIPVENIKVVVKILSVSPWRACNDQLLMLEKSLSPPPLWERYFESGIGADVSLMASDGIPIKAHSGILITASRFFEALFETDMEESMRQEIRMEDMTSSQSLRTFLKCLYTGSLAHLFAVGLNVLVEILNAAEKYELESLKMGAAMFLPGYCSDSNALELLHFAKRYRLGEAEDEVRKYIRGNVDSVMDCTIPHSSAQ